MDTLDLHCSIFGLMPDPLYAPNETACCLLPGLNKWRVIECPWEVYASTLLVAGTSDDPAYTEDEIRIYLDVGILRDFSFQGYAAHTPGQMAWLVKKIKKQEGIMQVILTTAAYHLPRCALTFAKEWLKNGKPKQKFHFACIPMIAGRTGEKFLTGFTSDAEFADKATRGSSQTVASEIARIEAYQKKGDVATAEEFAQFLDMIS